MLLSVRIPDKLEKRLNKLSESTQRPKSFYVKEALEAYLDMHEVELSAVAEYEEKVRNGTLKTLSLDEIKKRYGIDESSD